VPDLTFTPEADDYFEDMLAEMCKDSLVVRVVPLDGPAFDAVLLTHDGRTLLYEGWDHKFGPDGRLGSVALDELSELRVL
jgi:hypothetical protein